VEYAATKILNETIRMDKKYANFQPWEKSFNRMATPFEEFIHDETASGLILMF